MRCERVQLVAEFFPDFAAWLAKSKSQRFLEEAERALLKAKKSAVEWACRQLLESPPRASQLPFEVARLAAQYDARITAKRWKTIGEGQTTVACLRCRDSGFVEVVHPAVREEIAAGRKPLFPYRAVVLCNCARGERRAEISAALKLPQFDPQVHIPLGDRCVGEVLRELAERYVKTKRAG
jgi:hypothetical protein